MAKGRAGGSGWLVAGVIVLTVLVATGTWNPFPALWSLVNRDGPIAAPAAAWQVRLGGPPKTVTIAGSAVVVEHRTAVEARSLTDGRQLWQRDADWSAVAGEGTGSVAAVGKLLVKGYELLDPTTGTVLRKDTRASAVWTYRDALLDVYCEGAEDCTLRAWEPRGATPLWSVELPGIGFVLFADNPGLLGSRAVGSPRVDDGAGGPVPMPQLLGFPINGSAYVVDTASGRVLPQIKPERNERIAVVGRVLRITATSAAGNCYYTARAVDAANGVEVWQRDGYNFKTAAAGCAQREGPVGAGSALSVLAANGREATMDAYDGRLMWSGGPGEEVLALDDAAVLVRSPDKRTVSGYAHGRSQPLWSRTVKNRVEAALTPYAAILTDRDPDRIVALDRRGGGELFAVKSSGKIRAVGPTGVIVSDSRQLAFLAFGGVVSSTPPTGTPLPQPFSPPAGTTPGLDPEKKEGGVA
ncbi:outer membrane protein assembly factor BamB family protein [Rhizomonospora bruguierae]|uniref:outer membrane protein assembly factor BamB family protein n=1 Tax=Rhizomonospora bruguierae TaxID=1581705 RepID=UPI0020BE5F94|nr:PQQ-binding-like beta-propeller repeat protein [Micromonospora sp. NBRC 107566]